MCPDWNTSSLEDTLGISRQDMKDIIEGKHSQNVMPCFLRILACLNWAMSQSTLFSGERKYILPFNSGTAKLEFFNDAKNIIIFQPSDIQIAPFEILKIYINITIPVSQFVEFMQNEKCKKVLFIRLRLILGLRLAYIYMYMSGFGRHFAKTTYTVKAVPVIF